MKITKSVKLSTLMVAGLLVLALALSGCTGGNGENGGPTTISMGGSTTVQPLAEALGGAYMITDDTVEITVSGGGSSVGVSAAAEGTVDIGMVSRELKASEEELGLEVYVVAKDGIAIVAHTSQNIAGLTTEEVRDIFSGGITNWSEVGGADATIAVICREEGSGTRAAFEDMVMGDEVITGTAILLPSNGAVRTAVSTDANSIGFISFGYIDETVKALDIDGVEATFETALSGEYPIVRPLLLVTLGEPTGKVADFIGFCLGPDGQVIVAESYIPTGPTS